jgi:hypothetical protein
MSRSLLVVLVCTFAVLLLGAGRVLLFPGRQSGPQPVEYQSEVRLARQVTGSDLPGPRTLPLHWIPTSATVTGRPGAPDQRLVIGFDTPGGNYAAEESAPTRSARAVRPLLRAVLGSQGLPVGGVIVIDGQRWLRRTDSHRDSVLTRTASGVTTILLGTGGVGQLRTLALALRGLAFG